MSKHMRTVDAWEDYRAKVLAKMPDGKDVDACKRAFWAGAVSMHSRVMLVGTMEDDAAKAHMDAVEAEVLTYLIDGMRGIMDRVTAREKAERDAAG